MLFPLLVKSSNTVLICFPLSTVLSLLPAACMPRVRQPVHVTDTFSYVQNPSQM